MCKQKRRKIWTYWKKRGNNRIKKINHTLQRWQEHSADPSAAVISVTAHCEKHKCKTHRGVKFNKVKYAFVLPINTTTSERGGRSAAAALKHQMKNRVNVIQIWMLRHYKVSRLQRTTNTTSAAAANGVAAIIGAAEIWTQSAELSVHAVKVKLCGRVTQLKKVCIYAIRKQITINPGVLV